MEELHKKKLAQVVKAAESAFWQKVSDLCPEIWSSDFPESLVILRLEVNEISIKTWYKHNQKRGNHGATKAKSRPQ